MKFSARLVQVSGSMVIPLVRSKADPLLMLGGMLMYFYESSLHPSERAKNERGSTNAARAT